MSIRNRVSTVAVSVLAGSCTRKGKGRTRVLAVNRTHLNLFQRNFLLGRAPNQLFLVGTPSSSSFSPPMRASPVLNASTPPPIFGYPGLIPFFDLRFRGYASMLFENLVGR